MEDESGSPGFNAYGRLLRMWGRRLWWLGLLLIVVASVGAVTVVFENPGTRDLIQSLAAVVTIAAGAGVWLWTRARPMKVARLPLERAADELAEQLRRQWELAATERGLIHPIPLRWRWSLQKVTGPAAEAVKGSFPPLPGVVAVTVQDLQSGTVEDLFRVYGGLGSGRLIVLGDPGAGKSGAGILLVRAALGYRAALTADERARVPVPVLVTPQGWDPTAERFTQWLAAYLVRDYALLRAPEYGEDAVVRLIEGGYLTVILDGLDEMPEELRPKALRALNKQATFRLVVLSRSQELVAAVSGGHLLRGAAALELLPIDSQQAAEYLASSLIDPLPARWQLLLDDLRQHPDGVLAQALDTPLTLTLVRDTYDSGEGIDKSVNTSEEAIENYLLDQVLTAAYAHHPGQPIPPYTGDQAKRWLGRLARRMNDDKVRDLRWWQIQRWAPAWPRVFTTVMVMSVVTALLVGSWTGFAAHMHLLAAFGIESLTAVTVLFGKTLGYAFMFGLGLLLMSPSEGGSPLRLDRPRWTKTDILIIFIAALGVGIGFGLEKGLLQEPKRGLAIGLVVSFVVGLAFVLGGGPPQQLGWLRWTRTDTRTNLRTGLGAGLVVGIVTGLGYGLGYDLNHGIVYGFIVGIGYMLAIVVDRWASPQWSQPRGAGINAPTVLLIGLIIAIASGAASYGITYILIVILGGRLPLLRSQLRWSKTATPTALLTGLVAGPVLGLIFGLTSGIFQRLDGQDVPYGLALGLVFGLMIGLLLGLRQPSPEATNPLDPQSLWRRERRFGLGLGLIAGLIYGLVYGLVGWSVLGSTKWLTYGLTAGFMIGLGTGLISSTTWAAALANAQLRRRDETPARLLRFLDDARRRQLLRTVGPAYQFRHTRLQDRLAEAYGTTPPKRQKAQVDHIPSPRRPTDDTPQESRRGSS